MVAQIRRWLAPPAFDAGDDRARQAHILNILLLAQLSVLGIGGLLGVFFLFPEKLVSGAATLMAVFVSLGCKALLQSGRLRLASQINLVLGWLLITGLVLISGGAASANAFFYFSLVVGAGLLLGARSAMAVASLSGAVLLLIAFAEARGYALPSLLPQPPLSRWLLFSLAIGWALIPLSITFNTLVDSLKRLRQELAERQRAEQALTHYAEQARQRADQLAMLNEVAHAVSTLRDVDALLETIYQQVKHSLPLDVFLVGLYDAETGQISFPIMYDDGQCWDESAPRPLTESSFSGRIIRSGQPLLVNQSVEQLAARSVPPNIIGDKTRPSASLMFAPLPAGGRIIGVISAQSYAFDTYGAADLDLLVGIAYQAAIAIENARLYEKAQERTAQLTMMNEIGRAVSALQDLDSVLELIYCQVQKIAPVDAFYIALYDPECKQISFPITYDVGIRYNELMVPLQPDTMIAEVIQTGEPFLLLRTLEEMQEPPRRPIGNEQRKSASMLLVPLWLSEQVIGVLSVQSYALNAYTDEHADILTGVGHQVAIAIENATLFTAAQQELAERQRMEAQLRESEERYRLISAVSSDYTFSTMLNVHGELHLNWVAGAFEKITGYSYEEYMARGGWLTALHPDDVEQDARDMEQLRTNRPVVTEVRTLVKGGAVRWVRVYGHPVWHEAENRLVGIYGAVQDITERKQAEAEREQLIRELEGRNAELERFTYTVSHDLKSPLITIRGFLGFLERHAVAGDLDRFKADVNRIINATNRMQRLLDELLELSRIGRLMNQPERLPFEAIVREAVELVHGQIEARKAQVRIMPDLPVVYVDRARLVEVVQNLVDNACKFTGDQAEPQITIGMRGTDRDGRPILFVQDNGSGIDPQYHEKVFGLFDKLDATSDGTGVGLALVKRIIEVHGGRIWVESRGQASGATFCFTLPVSAERAP